jgi:hypothetical protein
MYHGKYGGHGNNLTFVCGLRKIALDWFQEKSYAGCEKSSGILIDSCLKLIKNSIVFQ